MRDEPAFGDLLPIIRELHNRIRQRVVAACESRSTDELSQVSQETSADTIFAIDRVSETELVDFLERNVERTGSIVLVAEGLEAGAMTIPRGTDPADARWRMIVDPIDGTRCIMYQKRNAWVLTGVAPNRGDATNLSDIQLAVQTEIPIVKQHLCDQFWAIRGDGAGGERTNRLTGATERLSPRPSSAPTIEQGYATVTRFFPGARDVLAAIDDEIAFGTLGKPTRGKALTFEDQYPSTGGQIYGLFSGQDRFIADLRPLTDELLARRGTPLGLCCHPYDICTSLIAEELGATVSQPDGSPLDAKLDLSTEVAWVGYANEAIRRQVQPALFQAMHKHGLMDA